MRRIDHGASVDVGKDPWTDPDPQPGDFDAELDRGRSDQIEMHEGNPHASLSILAGQASCIAFRYAIQRHSDPK